MSNARLFLDTAFIQALLNPKDTFHNPAKALLPHVRNASEVWITEAILIEVGNALSALNRAGAIQFIQQCYRTDNIRVISVGVELMTQALTLYQSRMDKAWGMTDCISFVVMQTNGLTDAATTDRHFIQAGFRALLLEDR
ncbi:MAG: nucleic acid-binding protein [Cyanobacteria bacterium J06635_15]